MYDYFLDHKDIISQYSTFNFSNEQCFDKSALDRVAKRLLPKDRYALFPVFTKGGGNYFLNSISLLLTGEQSQLSTNLRIKVVGEMVKNRSLYYAGDFLKYGVDNFVEDMLDSMRSETYSSFRHMYALANVVCCNIRSVYPESKNPFVKRNDLNVTISPRVKTKNTALKIWPQTAHTDLENDWQPNHFVLLIPERLIGGKPNETQPIRRKCDIKNFFAKIPSSKSTEKKAEVTQVQPAKTIKKENKVKNEGEGKTKEKKNKEDDHNTRKIIGFATYRCKFDKEWSKKNNCIQPVKEDPHAFFCTICSKKVSCSHQALGDLVRHCKTPLHIKFKDQMTRQHKIEKPE